MHHILIGLYCTETNSFAPGHTVLADFGQNIFDPETTWAERGKRSWLGALLHVLEAREDVEVIPTVAASAEAGSPVELSAHNAILQSILSTAEAHPEIDGVVMFMHGAIACDGEPDAEGAVLEALRAKLGMDVPIIIALDLHANMTDRMLENATAFILYDNYPHTDIYDCCVEAAQMLLRTLDGEIRPVMRARRLPLLSEFVPTTEACLTPVLDRMHALEKQPGVLAATIAYGFFLADIPQCHSVTVAVADGDAALAQDAADNLAAVLWNQRHEAKRNYYTLDEALAEVNNGPDGTYVLADCSDNPGGGSPGDGTHILRGLLDRGVQNAVVAAIFDPATVEQAEKAGVGAVMEASIGGKIAPDPLGFPVVCRAEVVGFCDTQPSYGRVAVLKVDGVHVLVQSKRFQMFRPDFVAACGIAPETCRIIVVKSNIAYRSGFGPMARKCIEVCVPGLNIGRPTDAPLKRCLRPVYPLDDIG